MNSYLFNKALINSFKFNQTNTFIFEYLLINSRSFQINIFEQNKIGKLFV